MGPTFQIDRTLIDHNKNLYDMSAFSIRIFLSKRIIILKSMINHRKEIRITDIYRTSKLTYIYTYI